MTPQKTGHPALRNGLIFGAILGALGLGNTLIQWAAGAYHLAGTFDRGTGFSSVSINNTGGTSFLGCVVFLAMLALTFIAGMLAARGTHRVGSGAIAGLLTGVFGGLISGVGSIVVMAVVVVPSLEIPANVALEPAQVGTLVVAAIIFAAILMLLVDTGIGAGMGALGGLLGAKNRHEALPPAPPSYTPGYPGYPAYPGMPAQPGSAPQAWPPANPPQYPQYPQNPQPQGNPPYPQQ